MSFRLVPKSVTLNDLERRNGVIVRYPTEFGSHVKLSFALGLGAFWYWFLADVNSRSRSLYRRLSLQLSYLAFGQFYRRHEKRCQISPYPRKLIGPAYINLRLSFFLVLTRGSSLGPQLMKLTVHLS